MIKSCNFFIASRYLRAKKFKYGLSFLPLVVILAVAISLFIVLTVKFVFNGFQDQIGRRISDLSPNIEIMNKDKSSIHDLDTILNLLKKHAYIKTIEPVLEVPSLMEFGSFKLPVKVISFVNNNYHLNKKDIVLNSNIAKRVGAFYDDRITIISPRIGVTLFGLNIREKVFNLVNIEASNARENAFDNKVYISFDIAKKLFLHNNVNKINIYVDDVFNVIKYKKNINKLLLTNNINNLDVTDWIDKNKMLFDAIKIEHTAIMILISLIILVAAVNIFSVLIMLINNRKNDIGILLSMGLNKIDIAKIYFYAAIIMGLLGIIIGDISAILFSKSIPIISQFLEKYFNFYMLNGERFGLNYMPSSIASMDILVVSSLSLLIIILSAIYPVYKIAQVSPVKVLNYDK